MIIYVNDRLNRWAEWVLRGKRVVGLDYPSQCSYTRMSGCNDRVFSPEFDEESYETESAIQRLDEPLKRIVMVFYLETSTIEQKAKALHCCRDTVYSRLERAHHALLGIMNDIAAGC